MYVHLAFLPGLLAFVRCVLVHDAARPAVGAGGPAEHRLRLAGVPGEAWHVSTQSTPRVRGDARHASTESPTVGEFVALRCTGWCTR